MNTSKTLVLYHADCADGFGAAWAARKSLGDTAAYVPVQYDKPYPSEIDSGTVENLYILDFSYPLDTMETLRIRVKNLVVIDHHETAREPLELFRKGCPFRGECCPAADERNVEVIFDQQHSGAVLAWRYFHPGKPLPALLDYVEDRDLWRWKFVCSREVSAALRSYPMEFEIWDRLAMSGDQLPREGEAILRAQAQQVEAHIRSASLKHIGGYEVPVVNATVLMSEIGEALCERFPDAPFAATFFVREDNLRVYSLRSRNGFDVSEVAKKLGGGGHKAAAGFVRKGPNEV